MDDLPCTLIFTKLSPNPSSLSGTSFFSPLAAAGAGAGAGAVGDCLATPAREHLAEKNANSSCCLTIASSHPCVFSIIIFNVILSLMTWARFCDDVGGDSGRGGRGGNVPVGRRSGAAAAAAAAAAVLKGAAKSLEMSSPLAPCRLSPSSMISSTWLSLSSLSSHTLHPASTAFRAASQSLILVNNTPSRCQLSTFFSSISRLLWIASIAWGICRAWA